MQLDYLGKYGPQIILLISIPLLWTKKKLLNYVLVGGCLSIFINIVLKFVFHRPRPETDLCGFAAIVKKTTFMGSIYSDPFGFPSGHSQQATFMAMIMYYVFGLRPFTVFLALYSVYIMYHRIHSKEHYIYQVIGGAITGAMVATGVYYSYKTNLMGHIIHKLDDWSRIF